MDRRQRKTLASIYEAFESLMAERHYSQVTVAQIIERADIGRSTFYAHFETKDDLLSHMCTEMFAHVSAGFDDDHDRRDATAGDSFESMFAHLLYHLRDSHRGICIKLVAEGEPHFTSRFRELLAQMVSEELGRRRHVDAPDSLVLEMYVSALCQAITWWHREHSDAQPEQIASWCARCLLQPAE